jgi:RimJ/RimL family protein N-acetyltransferase
VPSPLVPPEPPLSDGVVTLRPPDPARDAPTIPAFTTDPEIVQWILGGTAPTDTDPEDVSAPQLEAWRRGTDGFFWINAAGHDLRVGMTRVMLGMVDAFGFAEIGYILLPEGRRRGYASRTVRLVARWVFDDLGLGRLQARTALDHVASHRVLERVGFQREGIARAGHVLPVSRERIDCLMWSLLPGELR